jgi:hypothetical protein
MTTTNKLSDISSSDDSSSSDVESKDEKTQRLQKELEKMKIELTKEKNKKRPYPPNSDYSPVVKQQKVETNKLCLPSKRLVTNPTIKTPKSSTLIIDPAIELQKAVDSISSMVKVQEKSVLPTVQAYPRVRAQTIMSQTNATNTRMNQSGYHNKTQSLITSRHIDEQCVKSKIISADNLNFNERVELIEKLLLTIDYDNPSHKNSPGVSNSDNEPLSHVLARCYSAIRKNSLIIGSVYDIEFKVYSSKVKKTVMVFASTFKHNKN